jgi:uncharacterized repeat protein (TIGR03803 family)
LNTNGYSADGANSQASLVMGPDGNPYLFGTTSAGGSEGVGTAFQISVTGVFSNLHSFGTLQDTLAEDPVAALVLGSDGNFYGTASEGGSNQGTVFRMTTNGAVTTLYNFGTVMDTNGNSLDGVAPEAPLLLARDGNFYGTTSGGGINASQSGTVFQITPSGALKTLYSFGAILDTNGDALDGSSPEAGLIQGNNGLLYSTTSSGGKDNNGTVFQISTNGEFETLYRFTGGDDGSNPDAALILLGNTLYGTASTGGSEQSGTVFSITLGGTGPPAPPKLAIIRSGTNVILTWPSTATGFTLQFTTDLAAPAVWSSSSPAPVIVDGQYTVTNAITNRTMYYRLEQ